MTRLAVNGIELNVEVSGDGPLLLLLHGFTGDRTTWEPFLDAWQGLRIIRVDIIGHGKSDSPDDPKRYAMGPTVADLLAILDQLNVDKTILLGYSMGGRLALHLALAAPQRLSALVLESASPGIESAEERAARVRSDEALAGDIERDGMEVFVDRWQAQGLFASQSRLPAEVWDRQRNQRLSGTPRGLANSLRGMGAGTQDYLMPRIGELTLPTFFLAGSLDERYAALAVQMSSLVPNSEVLIIPDASHTAHLEEPSLFAEAARDFIERRVRLRELDAVARAQSPSAPGGAPQAPLSSNHPS